MSRNNNGQYTLPAAVNPVVDGTTIESNWANTTLSDVAAALTTSIASTGVTTPSANLPMGGYRHTGVGDATARNNYLTMGQAQDMSYSRISGVAGSNNITGTLPGWVSGTPAAYPNGVMVSWVHPATNTGAVTINLNSMGAKSLVTSSGAGLVGGDLVVDRLYIAYYDSDLNSFVMLSDTTTTAENGTQQSATSGWIRPVGGSYPAFTNPASDEVGVPAGIGRINTVGDLGVVSTTYVDWDASTVTLSYVASDYATTLMVDSTGAVVQFAGEPPPAAYRENIYLCNVAHPSGSVESIYRKPVIYGDDGYLLRDVVSLIGNMLMAGGKITENGGTALHLDITDGTVFYPGGDPDTANSPNLITFTGVTDLSFYTQSGSDYLAGPVQLSPITAYNPGGANAAATAIPAAANAVIHRLYWMDGVFYWVYGQTLYSTFDDALKHILVDRSEFQLDSKLTGATLIAEIISTKNATDYTDPTKTAIISNSGRYYLFGSAQSINDVPVAPPGITYGREAGGNWVPVISSTSPVIATDATITGTAPQLNLDFSGAPTGFAGIQTISSSSFDYVSWEVNETDDKLYLRSRNPADGVLRYTWTYNLANGATTYPGAMTVGALTCGAVTSSGDATFSGTAAVQVSAGTTAQRPAGVNGMVRYNTTTASFEGYIDGAWGNIGGGATSDLFYENDQTISTNTTLTAGRNSMTAGPITIADGVTVTVPSGANWVIV